ncbi:hypothetical protein OMP38_06275 [Cohnella ginsengisoli]|uniref:Uncharacterized protein n=1 Tax=Cohnella ginsengisoli TaxID=425004 RepID=A0A9X4KED3_9BACL|nr:hypothetical protein [Cohnella ginsengisoli]MDG0790497.1 hypothetical protein [Cohnella ginsengisoli]
MAMVGAGLTIGSALLVTSAFADIGGEGGGYEAYKTAVKTTAAASNATQHYVLSVQDNGQELLNVNGTLKASKAARGVSGSAEIATGAASELLEFYHQDGSTIFKSGSSDTYNVASEKDAADRAEGHDFDREDPAVRQGLEKLVDALVGHLKNNVNLSDGADGAQAVDMTLKGSQIPATFNVIGSLVVKEALNAENAHQDSALKDTGVVGIDLSRLDAKLPRLTQDVNVDEVSLHAEIDGNHYIVHQIVELAVTGKDEAGVSHRLTVSADIDTSDVNATTPDTVDLTGKKINKVEPGKLQD